MRTFTQLETNYFSEGYRYIAGVDESGRGPLAGPVIAAAVIFPGGAEIPGIDDSKRLSAARREELAEAIKSETLNWAIGTASVKEIDRLNILRASRLAMKRAVEGLVIAPDLCLADGLPIPDWNINHREVVKGDRLCFTIAAASILAKVHRDELMRKLHKAYPQYSFDCHKGYPTLQHRNALLKHGICPAHRKSFNLLGDEIRQNQR